MCQRFSRCFISASLVALIAYDCTAFRPALPLSADRLGDFRGGTTAPPPPMQPKCYVSGEGAYCDGWEDTVYCGNATIENPLPACNMNLDPPQCEGPDTEVEGEELDNVRAFDPNEDLTGLDGTSTTPAPCGTCTACQCLEDAADPFSEYCASDDNDVWECGSGYNKYPDGNPCNN